IEIIYGETYNGYYASGTYTEVLTSALGCDSIANLTLTVNPNTITAATCASDSIIMTFAGVEPFTVVYSEDIDLPNTFGTGGYPITLISPNIYQAKVPVKNLSISSATITDDNKIKNTTLFAITVNPTPTIEFPQIVDPCDGGDILVTLSGVPPFTVEYNVSESGKAFVPASKLGLGSIFGEGGYPLTKTGSNTYSAIIPSGSAKILTFEKISIEDGNGCVGK
ncbi:MAG: hypothetical protein LBV75_00030, partial [Paludibacter sp.]|nr:hypothetical protein [Paludibacter sp.]